MPAAAEPPARAIAKRRLRTIPAAAAALALLSAALLVPAPGSPLIIAQRCAAAGETELAFPWLEKAFQAGKPQLLYLKANPGFVSLHSDPRFAELLRRIGFPE